MQGWAGGRQAACRQRQVEGGCTEAEEQPAASHLPWGVTERHGKTAASPSAGWGVASDPHLMPVAVFSADTDILLLASIAPVSFSSLIQSPIFW